MPQEKFEKVAQGHREYLIGMIRTMGIKDSLDYA